MKKKFFRSLSVILAIMMMALMIPTMTAFAADQVTVTLPNNVDATITFYKVATATKDGTVYDYKKINDQSPVETAFQSIVALDEANDTLKTVTGSKLLTALTNEEKRALAAALANAATGGGIAKSVSTSDVVPQTVSLDVGYYVITVSNHAPMLMEITAAKTIASSDFKGVPVDITKKITKIEDKDGNSYTDNSDAVLSNGDLGTVGKGSKVTYTITTNFPKYYEGVNSIYNFVITDTPASGIEIQTITVSAASDTGSAVNGTETSTIDQTNWKIAPLSGKSDLKTGFTVTFKDSYVLNNGNANVTITVVAEITAEATELDNEAKVEYDNDFYTNADDNSDGYGDEPGTDVDTDNAKVYEAEVELTKTFDDITTKPATVPSNGSTAFTFTLYDSKNNVVATWVADLSDWNDTATGFKHTFKGLQAGTYTLKETVVPEGYKQAADKTIVISATASTGTVTYTITDNGKITINNSKGTSLPGTGGMGTVIFTVAGIGVVLLAGVMFVLYMRKRRIED